jgi:hypothetical protein
MNDVANAIDGLLAGIATNLANSSISTTSTSFVDTGFEASITGASGETLLALATIAVSQSTAGMTNARILHNGGQIGQAAGIYATQTGTTGDQYPLVLLAYTPAAIGSNTVKIQYAAGAGTLYSFYRSIYLFTLQTS